MGTTIFIITNSTFYEKGNQCNVIRYLFILYDYVMLENKIVILRFIYTALDKCKQNP